MGAAILWYGATVPPTIILAPFGLLGLIALGTAVGLLLAPLNLLYRDVSKLLVTATTFWLFVSPVYFPAPAVGTVGTIMSLNPVTPLLSATRALALTGRLADPTPAVSVGSGTILLLALCWMYARVALPVAIEQCND
jgi:lipopolysaccharide transport system permease protein